MELSNVCLLIVTYHFPPDGAIGGIRPYQFARLLPQYGIETTVVTVEPKYAERIDQSFLPEGIPSECIVRTEVYPSRRDRYLQMTAFIRAWWRKRRSARFSLAQHPTTATRGGADSGASHHLLWRCFSEWIEFPDWQGGWFRPALRAAEQLLQHQRYAVVLSTSPPRTAALIARTISRRYRLPWIMDMRDPWTGYSEGWGTVQCPLFRRLHRLEFVRCLRQAAAIIVNTSSYALRLREEYPFCAQKVHVLPNGLDDRVAVSRSVDVSSNRLVIAHFGTVYGSRSSRPFLEGVARWLEVEPAGREKVEVWFYGDTSAEDISSISRQYGIAEVVRVHPPVGRHEVSRLMGETTVLLLLAQGQPLQIPGKTYEYLATDKPIIAMTEHDGATGLLLQKAPGCYIAEQAEDVVASLHRLWRHLQTGTPVWTEREKFLAPFRYSSLAKQLADIVEHVVERGQLYP